MIAALLTPFSACMHGEAGTPSKKGTLPRNEGRNFERQAEQRGPEAAEEQMAMETAAGVHMEACIWLDPEP